MTTFTPKVAVLVVKTSVEKIPGVSHIESTPFGGAKVVFDNGWSLSIQNSPHHYSGDGTFETAVFDADDKFFEWQGDNVQGWQTPDDIRKTVDFILSQNGSNA